jgi:hypothetical protein
MWHAAGVVAISVLIAFPTATVGQSRNFDVGSDAGVPPDSYGGLGEPGPWEPIENIVQTSFLADPESPLGKLLNDFTAPTDLAWHIDFKNLIPGTYRIITYACADRYGCTYVWTDPRGIAGSQHATGPCLPEFRRGVTHTVNLVEVPTGVLTLYVAGGISCVGPFNGFQIVALDCDAVMPATDCNTNGVLDDCDLAAATSEDCNDNLQPDECDELGDAAGSSDVTLADFQFQSRCWTFPCVDSPCNPAFYQPRPCCRLVDQDADGDVDLDDFGALQIEFSNR